jgi:carbamoyl-phosphate synthase large subunit
MNPRVSRSSALASKATGYPIAKVAAKLAVGYTLPEIPNDLTKTTPASFEPTLDYVVVKFPRFAFEKFPGADETLGTQMKSVGEAMGIGRTFTEAYLKALRSRELDAGAATPWTAFDDLPAGIHPWFAAEIERVRAALDDSHDLATLKRLGISDAAIAAARDTTEERIRAARAEAGIRPVYRRVDSCAAEVEAQSNYLYSTWGEADEATPEPGRSVVILGSGPNRIGQGIEFDYCCVHAATSFREAGFEAVMVNCNPETVSTDYDTSDRLYFEPLGVEEVLSVLERERPHGVVIQFGGQTPLKLARAIESAGFRVLGTPFEAIDLAEDRERFGALLASLGIRCPEWGMAETAADAVEIAEAIGYPVLVRPSYVLGGRAMRVCYDADAVREALLATHARVLIDRFLENAIEIDVDALADGDDCYIGAVMQHVEEAGVHSGDSACVLPAPSLSAAQEKEISETVRAIAKGLGVVGLLNVQLAIADGDVFVLEANPRASRTVPFASKATGVNLVRAACRLAAGANLRELELPPERPPAQVSVKAAVLPFHRFPGSDPVLGPEMRATGEVMASAADLPTAFAKAERAAGRPLPHLGTVFLSVRDADKPALVPVAAALAGLGFRLMATNGTASTLEAAGLDIERVLKVSEEGLGSTVVDLVRRGRCDLVINTPQGRGARTDGYAIREAAMVNRVPCITTISGAAAAVHAIASARTEIALSLQERIANEARAS